MVIAMVVMVMMMMMITLLLIVAPRAVWERVERPLVEGTVRWRAAPSHSHVLHHDDVDNDGDDDDDDKKVQVTSKYMSHTVTHTHTAPSHSHVLYHDVEDSDKMIIWSS